MSALAGLIKAVTSNKLSDREAVEQLLDFLGVEYEKHEFHPGAYCFGIHRDGRVMHFAFNSDSEIFTPFGLLALNEE